MGGIPHTQWNGIVETVGGYPNGNWEPMYNQFLNIYNSMSQNQTPFILDVSVGGTGDMGMFDVTLTLESSYQTANHRVEIFLFEDYIYSFWTAVGLWGDARFVTRDWISSNNITISSAGETQEFSGSFPIDESWEVSNVGIVAIVQNIPTKEVKQAEFAYVSLENYMFLFSEFVDFFGDDDDDGVLNPGEEVDIILMTTNESIALDADNVVGVISTESPVTIPNPVVEFGNINAGGGISSGEVHIMLDQDIPLGDIVFTIDLTAEYVDLEGNPMVYNREFDFTLEVSLYQANWPFENSSQIESSPVVFDIDGNGTKEVIFGDYSGFLHVVSSTGTELPGFPFDFGDDIWGSPAVADLEGDGDVEIVMGSKNKHLFVLNADGSIQVNYNSGQFLMGTPALGNIDDDADLEIIFGGYSSPGKLFAINPDGSNVPGFPLQLDEKIQRGVALADFNGNGKVDIVCGTDSEHLWLIYDDLTVADGFPFEAGHDFRTDPSVLSINEEMFIFAGSRDDNFYALNSDGSLRFQIESGGDISESSGIVDTENGPGIFFGSNDGYLYGVDLEGNSLPGWPIDLEADIVSSPCFADLDGDGIVEVIAATNEKLYAVSLNGMMYAHFPIDHTSSFSGSPTIADIDLDNDLEILIGSINGLVGIDIKEFGMIENQWNMHRGNPERTGFYSSSQEAASVTVEHLNDWNLVGLPMNVEDSYYLTVFPDAVEETLFSFDISYIQESNLEPGNGYWLRFDSEGSNIITGVSIPSLTVHLSEDWNLISGITSVVDVNTISDPDELIIPETFFGFSGSYLEVTELEPGQGYWVRSAGEGDITISAGMRAKRREYINHLEGASTLVVNGQTLYFGMDVPDDNKLSYSLPPKPPPGAFDVRFAGDWKYSIDGGEIQLMSAVPTLSLSYNVIDGEEWILTHSEKGIELPLNGSGLLEIPGDISSIVLTRRVEEILPGTFTLKQNYPNPFNPVTEIKYEIPEEGFVSLKVFNILGEEVAVLVNERQPQGNYTATFSAGILPSGVYVYTLESGGYTSVKKCVLMK